MDQFGSGSTPGQSPLPAQTPGVWPPPPTGTSFGQSEEVNTSGMKGEVPPEIARLKWNWGAFFLPFLWSVSHKIKWGWGILVLSLLSRVPGIGPVFVVASLVVAIYVGLKGHTLGWQNRRFEGGLPQYFEVQRKWLTWGLVVIILAFIVGLMAGIAPYLAAHRSSI